MSVEAAVMVVYDEKANKVLSEQRTRPDRAYYGEKIFLSGLVEADERSDPSCTARRELKEELGIEVIDIFTLHPDGPITGGLGEKLYPFIISKWEGDIPDQVIGNNNPLVWDTLEEAIHSRVVSRVVIANLARGYLLQKERV